MKTKLIFPFILLMAFLLSACDKAELNGFGGTGNTASPSETPLLQNQTTSVASLTSSEQSGLLLMREEEKMAHDVYLYFAATYNRVVFTQIAGSEATHMSAVLGLIEYYGLTDPAYIEAGRFSNPDIQSLYTTLIAKGSTVENALATGAYIEEYDIADLKKLIAATSNANIIRVYSNLLSGSENHLRAFVTNLKSLGVTYQPAVLTADEYAAIISANTGGSTIGNGYRGGR